MHPKTFEKSYIRKDYFEQELSKMLLEMGELEYKNLNEYDKGGFDGYNQAVTEMLRKLQMKFSKDF
ncbi:MAG: hypothetical protein O9346_02855 [Leptospiraceae bacterium]|jgi:hypothetical protein|nr:hypothetical protein [Leptospiraceae bacterium]MCZ8237543.1 hypothetical protein [Leptospiraceae bacterium]MCZ8345334.1 hypothetical protein [Leptospiraceae bacterium]PJE04169.1 MAG: hypothetical protein CK427_02465 [Leptospira sp.]